MVLTRNETDALSKNSEMVATLPTTPAGGNNQSTMEKAKANEMLR